MNLNTSFSQRINSSPPASLHWERLSEPSAGQGVWSMTEDFMKLKQRPLGYKRPRPPVWTLSPQLVMMLWEDVGSLSWGGTGGSGLWEQKAEVCNSPALLLSASWSMEIWASQPWFCHLLWAVLLPSFHHHAEVYPKIMSQNKTFSLQLFLVFGHNSEKSNQYVFFKPKTPQILECAVSVINVMAMFSLPLSLHQNRMLK